MKYSISLILLSTMILLSGCISTPNSVNQKSESRRTSFNDDWRFSLQADSAAVDPGYNDSPWRMLNVPHDWSIEAPFDKNAPATVGGGALPGGTGWYRKTFRVGNEDKGRKISIEFDGVYWNSDVWINGKHVGHRPNGYVSFAYDLTPHLKYGDTNVVTVKVDNSQQPNSRWYSGSGIYRNVWLVNTSLVHVDHWGTFVTTPAVSDKEAQIRIETKIRNAASTVRNIVLETSVVDAAGNKVVSSEMK